MIGRSFHMIVPKARKKSADQALKKFLAGEPVLNLERPSVTKAGLERPGRFTFKQLTDDRGQPDAICLLAAHSSP